MTKNLTKFHVFGLNQEKWLSELCRQFTLSEIERISKNETTFCCSYFAYKKVEKFLKNKGVKIESITHFGYAYKIKNILTSYGLVAALVLCGGLYLFANQFVLHYDVHGVDKLSESEIVQYVSSAFPHQKQKINTKAVENALMHNFARISLASCIIKGQTLVINIKEKLLPDEMYGSFSPLVAKKSGKITAVNLVSGTLNVKVGDIVRAGDVLVEPFTLDASGSLKKVEAKAEIFAEVYNEGKAEHYSTFIEVARTGRVAVQNEIKLFGLTIYSFKEEMNYKMFDVEEEQVPLIKNLFLPFKLKKTTYFEVEEHTIESRFEDVEAEFVEKARAKALEICEDYAKMKEEFYTLRHLQGMTVVCYCIVTEEDIGGSA